MRRWRRRKGWEEVEFTKKEMLGCVQSVVGKKKFQVRFKDGTWEEMSTRQLTRILGKEEEVRGEKRIYFRYRKNQRVNF